MRYHTLFFSKIMKDVAKFSSAAFVIGALRVNVKTFEISEQSILKFIQAVHTVSIVLCIGCCGPVIGSSTATY